MNAASWAWKQFLMDAWDGFAITGSFFSNNFACTHYTHTVHIDKNNLWSASWNGFHILIMRRNDMSLTHLSLLLLRWDWYWFQAAWSTHDTRKMNNTVPLLNCCKLWVQWSGHLFKDLCMHLRKLQPIADLCASSDLPSPVMQSRIPQFPLHLLDVNCISTLACSQHATQDISSKLACSNCQLLQITRTSRTNKTSQ
jgi:hypothetical protein